MKELHDLILRHTCIVNGTSARVCVMPNVGQTNHMSQAHKEIIWGLLFALEAFANGLIEHLYDASRNVA
jgi:hypothetical protein